MFENEHFGRIVMVAKPSKYRNYKLDPLQSSHEITKWLGCLRCINDKHRLGKVKIIIIVMFMFKYFFTLIPKHTGYCMDLII